MFLTLALHVLLSGLFPAWGVCERNGPVAVHPSAWGRLKEPRRGMSAPDQLLTGFTTATRKPLRTRWYLPGSTVLLLSQLRAVLDDIIFLSVILVPENQSPAISIFSSEHWASALLVQDILVVHTNYRKSLPFVYRLCIENISERGTFILKYQEVHC